MKKETTVRINAYLAKRGDATRKGADLLVAAGKVLVNGKKAVLGQQISERDVVEVRGARKNFRYFAYHKPRGVITHSAQGEEVEISDTIGLTGVFPIGRLDKDSHGLIILTDDGRLTDRLLSPEREHEKEYEVRVANPLPRNFKVLMERGIDIGGYRTKPCTVRILGDKKFSIIITEGKKHQIRRMCGALGQAVAELKRVRIGSIKLAPLKEGAYRALQGPELSRFLASLGLA